MTFLKQNWFKTGILLVGFTLAVSAAYYFIFFLPEIKQSELINSAKSDCINEVDNLKHRMPEVERDYELLEVHYNEARDICYAYVLKMREFGPDTSFSHTVYNVNTMEEVMEANMLCEGGGNCEMYGPKGVTVNNVDQYAHRLMRKMEE